MTRNEEKHKSVMLFKAEYFMNINEGGLVYFLYSQPAAATHYFDCRWSLCS